MENFKTLHLYEERFRHLPKFKFKFKFSSQLEDGMIISPLNIIRFGHARRKQLYAQHTGLS